MEQWIEQAKAFVSEQLRDAEPGHDFSHVMRVYQMALILASGTKASTTIIALAALLHDVADAKFHGGDEDAGPEMAAQWMKDTGVDKKTISDVTDIIRHMSFRHSFGMKQERSIEFKIVQDADRLDAIGAIGIARAFSYGGHRNRPFYNENLVPETFSSGAEYARSSSPTINHFYEKLLLIKDRLHTDAAKTIALHRHEFMQAFLKQFDAEKEGHA
jgi:uncharacterized protein